MGFEPGTHNSLMELAPEQIKRFVMLHENGELDGYTEGEIREIANGAAQIYLTLLKISRRIESDKTTDGE